MKLKRFLSLAVALAMVLSIVPAFSLIASAELSDAAVLEYAKSTATLFDATNPAPTATNDAAVETAYPASGITTTLNDGYLNVNSGPRFQCYAGDSVNGNQGVNYLNLPGYGVGNDWVLVSYITEYTCAWGEVFLLDTEGKLLTGVRYGTGDSNAMSVAWGHNGWGNSLTSQFPGYTLSNEGKTTVASGSTQVDVLLRNYDGSYTATYFVNGAEYCVGTYEGTFNGLGQIGLCRNSGGSWSRISLQALKIYAGNNPSSSDATTISTALNELTVDAMTKGTDLTLATTAADSFGTTVNVEWTSSNTDVIDNYGNVTAPAELTKVTLTPSAEFGGETVTGNAHTVTVFPAVYTAEDEFSALGASYNVGEKVDLSSVSWYTRKSTAEETYGVTGLTEETVNGVKVTTFPGLGSAGALGDGTVNARTSIAVTPGQAYLIRFYYGNYSFDTNNPYAYNKVYTTAANYEDEVAIDYVSGTASSSIATTKDGWTEVEEIFIPSENANFLTFVYSWLGAGLKIADMELYTLVEDTTAVETVTEVADVTAVKVIGDTAVVLPQTVKVTGSLGSHVDAPIVWDAPATYGVGTVTVNGTATVQFGEQDATTEDVSTTVTVLEETFTLSDVTTVNGQGAGKEAQVAFPVAISDEFNMEFTANYASFGDLWITIKTKDAGFFSPEQIPLGVNASGAFRPVNGNGSGGRAQADSDLAYLTTGVNYRFFITTDASTDKYTVSIFDEAGVEVVTAENFGYRTNADAIECITSITNNGAGSVTLTNIKVNANVSKTEYTINTTIDGTTTSATASFWTDEEALASIQDIAGYEKAVSIEGTTITVVYSNVYTAHATFVDADDNTVKVVDVEVKRGETYTVAAEDVFFLKSNYEGHLYYIPETVISEDNNNLTVYVQDDPNKYPAIEDALITGVSEIWGIKATNENSVFVASAGGEGSPTVDANGERNHDANHTPSTLGTTRKGFFLFPVVDVEEGQKVTANFYVRTWHGNGFSNGNQTLRLAAYAVTDNSWATLSDGDTSYVANDAPLLESWNTPVFSEWCYNNPGYITFDITEMMVAAKAAGLSELTLKLNAPYGAAYIAEREAAVAGGQYEDKVAYIEVSDAGLVKVTETGDATLTKNGSAMNGFAYVASTDDVRLNAADAVVIGTDAGYYEANKNLNLTEATTFANTAPAGLGLAMVGGAQVRIGSTNLEEGGKLDALADSGIRFLATASYSDTVLDDETVEFGIKVSAEASENVAYIPAVSFQNDDNSVFSAAITSLKESNYNRKYTAVAYAKVPMADGSVKEFVTDGVTRSIYQVSAGIMKNGTADAENAAYTVEGVVKNVLNAYVNQTGIRLSYTADGIAVEENKYTGDVFFTVTSESDGDDGFNVTITPDATWGTPAEIAEWWTDYVRFNNNNSIAKGYISANYYVDGEPVFVHDDGSLTFNFDTTDDGTGGFDGPWVPIG
ncbi:MAG: hypothetical protein IJO83_08990 [Clostridia bacterium]|nr:hypothetical protein [Clostridia bacterium]